MFNYYFGLALRSLKRNIVLTALMIAAVGVGIGASMTTLTVFRAMDNDPIPQKSRQLFAVQIDNWGPDSKSIVPGDKERFQDQISYIDAVGLMNAKAAHRQAAMYKTGAALTPANPDLLPFQVQIRATYTDFFSMFLTPFMAGGPWSAADDQNHADVAVITQKLNDKLFGGGNSVGKSINLDNHEFRDRRRPGALGARCRRFTISTTISMARAPKSMCPSRAPSMGRCRVGATITAMAMSGQPGWEGRLHSECVWIQFWAELPTAADVASVSHLLEQLCCRSAAIRALPLAGAHEDSRRARMAGLSARGLEGSSNSGAWSASAFCWCVCSMPWASCWRKSWAAPAISACAARWAPAAAPFSASA